VVTGLFRKRNYAAHLKVADFADKTSSKYIVVIHPVSEEIVSARKMCPGDTFPRKFCPIGQVILSILGQIVHVCFRFLTT